MTKITHSELIEDNIFQPTIQEALQLVKALESVQNGFKGIAKEANGAMQKNALGSAEDISSFNAETQKATIASKEYEKAAKDRIRAEERLKQAIEGETDKTLQLRYEINKLNKEKRAEIQASDASLGAYKRASMQLNKLRQSYKDLAMEGKNNTAVAQKMKAEIDKLDGTLKKVDASVGQHQRSVGNYARAFNPLNNSINQLTREAPAFANSMQTGFMAISNNLPILSDAIKQLRHQNTMLRKEGKPTTSVLSQIAKGFFSWGTALSLGVTLLTVYGAELVDFIGGLFDANRVLTDYNETMKEVNTSTSSQITEVKILTSVVLDNTKSQEERSKALNKLKEQIPQLEQVELNHADSIKTVTYWTNKYVEASVAKLKVDKLIEKITELQTKRQDEQNKTLKESRNATESIMNIIGLGGAGLQQQLKRRNKDLKESLELEAKLTEDVKLLMLKYLNLEDESKTDLSKKDAKRIEKAKKERDIYEALEKSKIALIEDEIERKTQLLRLERDLSIRKIKDEYKASEERALLIENTTKRYNAEIEKLNKIDADRLGSTELTQDKLTEVTIKGLEDRFNAEEIAAKRTAEIVKGLETVQKNATERRLRDIDREVTASEERAATLRELAAQGQQDASESIALEEKRQAELELKREQVIRRQKRNEFILSGIKTYAAKVEKGDPNPVGSTIRDLTAISAAVRSLPAFYEGAENIAQSLGKPNMKGKDGYIVRVDGSERVLTGKQNAMIGNMSNEELASLAYKYRFNQVEPIKVDAIQKDSRHWTAMLHELSDLKKTVANKPEHSFDYDKVADMVIERVKKGNRIETKLKKNRI